MRFGRRSVDAAFVATILWITVLAGAPASAGTIVAFDFENATDGDPTAAASTVGPGISGAVFGGTKADSAVLLAGGPDLIYRSGGLDLLTDGGAFNFFSLTTSASLDLGTLSLAIGQNDTTSGTRDFEIWLSPLDATAPATGDRRGDISGVYTLLTTIAVPNGFALGAQNFTIDLSSTTLSAGTYHFAFAASDPSQFTEKGSTQLFVDDVILTPEPGTGLLLATGLIGLALRRRRMH